MEKAFPATRRMALRLLVGLIFLLLAPAGLSAVLGEATVHSTVGERLAVRVALAGVDHQTAKVTVGDAATYEAFGLERPTLADEFVLSLGRDGVLQVSTDRRIQDLFIDLVVVFTARGASESRHYPLLLPFPTVVSEPASAPIREPLPPRLPPLAPEPADERVAGVTAGAGRYTVRAGDTLDGIAGRFVPPGETRDWMADALFRLNPDAFQRGNRNRLRAGARLVLPAEAEPTPAMATREAASRTAAATSRRTPDGGRVRLTTPPEPEELADALADWIETEDSTLLASREVIDRDLNFARSEIRTYLDQNRGLRARITNLEDRIESLQRALLLQSELEARGDASRPERGPERGMVAAIAPDTDARDERSAGADADSDSDGRGGTPSSAATATASMQDSDDSYVRQSDIWAAFPYIGGFMVCILCGLLFYVRSHEERKQVRKRYARYHEAQDEVRSYLPKEL